MPFRPFAPALLLLLAGCTAAAPPPATAPAPLADPAALERRVAEACTHHGLSTDACVRLMQACFSTDERDRCEVMGRSLLPPEGP